MSALMLNDPNSIILYGGSFNPLHISHVLVHAALCAYFPLAQKWIVPSFSHAFHKELMSFERRMAVLDAVFSRSVNTVVSDIEARIGKSPTYTIDVVRAIHALYPNHAIWIVGGADLVSSLDSWQDIGELRRLARFVFFPRAGYDAKLQHGDMFLPMIELPKLSSGEVREAIARNDITRVQTLLPAASFDDLIAHGDLT